jgi:redox-sensing transcriptional repressor
MNIDKKLFINNRTLKTISKSSLQRLPLYLTYLKTLDVNDKANISATAISSALSLGEVQVRKDIACVTAGGKPKTGYSVIKLVKSIEDFLGYNNTKDAVIIGAGKLGRALLNYSGFSQYGFNIVAAFDINIKKENANKRLFPMSKFGNLCKRMNIKIGIITVPSASAQQACDIMTANGILAIWNFAPVHVKVPENVLIQNENMAVSLALLSNHLKIKNLTKY